MSNEQSRIEVKRFDSAFSWDKGFTLVLYLQTPDFVNFPLLGEVISLSFELILKENWTSLTVVV